MKNIYILFFFLFGHQIIVAQSKIFDDSYVHEIRITSTDPNIWGQLNIDYQPGAEIPYRSVTVEIDGNTLEEVGIRQKGFSSNFFAPTEKKPLKLNFGKFVEDREYDGVRKLNLMNGIGDPALVKDKLAYNLFRHHGVPAPRVSHAKLYIQDVYWGTYALIEQIDKRYLKRNFADNDGNLWKNKDNSDLSWQGTDPNNYTFELQTNEDENDWSKFIEFVDVINNTPDTSFKNELETIFDVDEYLRILAIDILINNWDSYLNHGRNWYLYHEPKTNKMHWLPWDYNFAFDSSTSGGGFSDFNIFNSGDSKVLIDRILEIPEWKNRYLSYMCEILQVNFTSNRAAPVMDETLDLINDDWGATHDFYTLETLNASINEMQWFDEIFGGQNIKGLKRFINERTTDMQSQISNEGNFTCISLADVINPGDVVINEFMASNAGGSIWTDQDGENDDWIELYNNTNEAVDLSNYFISDSPSFIHKWEIPANTIIPANGYLIVWADKDPQQEGLHTKFDLDKNKDQLILSYITGDIIDSYEWEEDQLENQSLSRIPNGTGDFERTVVTFNGENSTTLESIEHNTSIAVNIYPNPVETNLFVDFNGTDSLVSIRLHDVLGRLVYQKNNIETNVTIDISKYQTGIYNLIITNDNTSISKKIIVK